MKSDSKSLTLGTLLLAALAQLPAATWSSAVHAQSCDFTVATTTQGYRGQIATRRLNECIGGMRDTSEITVTVLTLNERARTMTDDAAELRRTLSLAIDEVRRETDRLAAQVAMPWTPLYRVLAEEIAGAAESVSNAQNLVAPEYWDAMNLQYFQDATNVYRIDLAPRVDTDCGGGAAGATIPAMCQTALDTAADFVRMAKLTERILEVAVTSRLEPSYQALVKLDADWDYYFDQGRSQYIWELALNSKRYHGRNDRLAGPPADQIILLHPGVAMEYVSGSVGNENAYNAVAVIEIVGYNRFVWGDKPGRKRRPFGASLVAAISGDDMGDRTGYGVMFHVNNKWSIGAVRRDTGAGDETTWLLSGDLMKTFLGKSAKLKQKFRFGD